MNLINNLQRFTALSFVFALIITANLTSCSGNNEVEQVSEGALYYEISYPYYDAGMFAGLFPDEMVMTFKDGKFVNTIEHKNGMFSSSVITDCKSKKVTMTLALSMNKYYIEMDEAQADSLLQSQFAMPEIFNTSTIDTAAGFTGNSAMAVFDNLEDGPDIEILYTNDILLDNPNWCTQFKDINAVLLDYELEQYGLRLRLEAKRFEKVEVDESIFTIDDKFEKISIDKFIKEFEEIFGVLMNN